MSTCVTNECAVREMNTTITDIEIRTTCRHNDGGVQQTVDVVHTSKIEDEKCNDALIKIPTLLTGREKRNISSPSCILHETSYVDPQSPSSSSSTSQATSSNDVTFEPTIEMMVNDFDDEQTLNEEEALASLESQNPDDEISTLKKESEMPLDELLAKYRALPPLSPPNPYSEPLRKKKKKSLHKDKHRQKHKQEIHKTQTSSKNSGNNLVSNKVSDTSKHAKANIESYDAEIADGKNLPDDESSDDIDETGDSSTLPLPNNVFTASLSKERESDGNLVMHSEIPKFHRSHLLDLYPEGTFDNVVVNNVIAGKNNDIPLETLYGVEDDEEDEEIDEEDEDYKKKVMIGTSYQATIPIGLSQYGDILPYENEDKLIWEPCQVSEREVEEYLVKIRDIKSNQQGVEDEHSAIETNSENQSKENQRSDNKIDNLENNSLLANADTLPVETSAIMEVDSQSIVKDNEQALHLLVQCGYDFKEALRRKSLNALPLNDCMSLWSEEECHKFEEGIQKYGKDFFKIRQNQVRTRTMRELVQFYYLWKKSERRDHNFANADTVDHMDIYLNEDNEYGSNPASSLTPLGSPVGNSSNCTGSGKNSNYSQKNISIMATATTSATQTAATNLSSDKNVSKECLQQQYHQQHHKRRIQSCNQSTLKTMTSDFNSEHSSSTISNSTK